FKFTLAGRIELRVGQDRGHALLEVEDTGVGVAPEEIPRLFERFYRVEGTRGRNYEGSGIGLALVQELVRLHGGSIDARSVLGQGTTLAVRIPLGARHLPQDHLRSPRSQTSTQVGAQAFVREVERWLPDATGAERPALRAEEMDSDGDRRFEATFGA